MVGLGDYEAEIEFYNPNTGKYATYYLSVDVEDGQLVKIYFPKGGWRDDRNFDPIDISEGEASFITYDGKSITVRLQMILTLWIWENLNKRIKILKMKNQMILKKPHIKTPFSELLDKLQIIKLQSVNKL